MPPEALIAWLQVRALYAALYAKSNAMQGLDCPKLSPAEVTEHFLVKEWHRHGRDSWYQSELPRN
jgi:hypothetical protein